MRQWIGFAALAALAACGGGGSDAGNKASAAEGGSSGGGSAAGAAMQAGLWEITTTVSRMSAPGMPAGANMPMPPPTTVRSCLTEQQAAQPGAGFFTGSGEGQGCSYESNNISGGRVQATVQCAQQGSTMRSTMTGSFSATGFDVAQQVRTSAQGMAMEMESRTVGRRVGDCPADSGS